MQVCLNLSPKCRESYGTTASLPRARRSPEQHTCATDGAGQEPQQAPAAHHGPPATASPGAFTFTVATTILRSGRYYWSRFTDEENKAQRG